MLDRTFSFLPNGVPSQVNPFQHTKKKRFLYNIESRENTCTVKLKQYFILYFQKETEMSLLSNSEMMHQKPNPNMIKDPFNRKSYLSHGELGLSQLQHYVGPDNVPELRAVHRDAYPTAIFYLATILGLYLLGLLTILIHYMNSSYGKWAWTLSDVWDEIRYFTQPFWLTFTSLTKRRYLLHTG